MQLWSSLCVVLMNIHFINGLQTTERITKPHIVFILADDLGYNDVGYNGRNHGSAMMTPNIDKLAADGVTLGNYYVQPICSPTRSQLMTGRYQIHTGLQHGVIEPSYPYCLPLDEVTLPEKLKEAGYDTHMIGKWHLGLYRRECLPTNRGFDTHLGFYLGMEHYYFHNRSMDVDNKTVRGYDLHRNMKPAWDYSGHYSTTVFAKEAQKLIRKQVKVNKPMFLYLPFQAVHEPLQVPEHYKEPFKKHIKDKDRQSMGGMLACLDEAIGNITQTLKDTGLYDNTVIIFSTDNGGPVGRGANNWPLRGSKDTLWEGGVHGVGFIHSPLLPKHIQGTTSEAFIHVSDWFPTIIGGMASGNVNGTKPLDGYNVWNAIINGTATPRTELLHNIDPLYFSSHQVGQSIDRRAAFNTSIRAALRVGDWKLVTGNAGYSKWKPPPESGLKPIIPVEPINKQVWLFNISGDPYEKFDLSDTNPDVVDLILDRMQDYFDSMVPPLWPKPDPNCDPAKHGGIWGPWVD